MSRCNVCCGAVDSFQSGTNSLPTPLSAGSRPLPSLSGFRPLPPFLPSLVRRTTSALRRRSPRSSAVSDGEPKK
jgi:hypothetical protein